MDFVLCMNLTHSTLQRKFSHCLMLETVMPKCLAPSKVKEHECAPMNASLRVSATKLMP